MSAAFAVTADLVLMLLGGAFKRKEKLSGRFADALSYMFYASAVLKRFEEDGQPRSDLPLVEWSAKYCLYQVQMALDEILRNFPLKWLGVFVRHTIFPLGLSLRPPNDYLGHRVASLLIRPGEARNRLTDGIYISDDPEDITGRLEDALDKVIRAEPLERRLRHEEKLRGEMESQAAWVKRLRSAGDVDEDEASLLLDAWQATDRAIRVDDFSADEILVGSAARQKRRPNREKAVRDAEKDGIAEKNQASGKRGERLAAGSSSHASPPRNGRRSVEKVWLKSYPPGVPEEVDLDAYRSVTDVFEQAIARFGDKPCFSNLGTVLTYDDMDRLTGQLAAYLQNLPGMERGDRVAIMMPNVLQNAVAIFATLRAGFTVVNTNPLYTARELEHQLVDSGAKTIIIMENFCHTLGEVIDQTPVEHVVTTQIGDLLKFPKNLIVNLVVKYVKKMVPPFSLPRRVLFKEALARGAGLERKPVICGHDDLAFLQYTGGTTGVAKGAMLTHGNMVANMQQASAWIRPVIEEGSEVIITALPLYHIFSLTANCLTFMKVGALNYLITNPRDMPNFVKELQGLRFTAVTGVNTLFNGLMNTPGFEQIDF